MRYSTIDIGSNAIRMMIAEVSPGGEASIIKKWRVPIRLGQDVFSNGEIGPRKLKSSIRTFKKFQLLNKKYKVSYCRAVGTSALREAKNKEKFVSQIYRHSRIRIEIIDGILEGKLIHRAVVSELATSVKKILCLDIGGGSIEITFSDRSKIKNTKSFPIGTVRLLNLLKRKKLKESALSSILAEFKTPLCEYLKENNYLALKSPPLAAGTGGNLECLGRLRVQLLNKLPDTQLTYKELKKIIVRLKKTSLKNRISKLGLRPDRADVVLPAAMVVEMVLKETGIKKILIPKVGLRDGVMLNLIQDKGF